MTIIVRGGLDPSMPEADGAFTLFPVLFVLVLVLGVGGTLSKVAAARRLAREAGMDPDDATAVALLGDPGLSTTYLASTLRGDRPDDAIRPPVPTAADRLRELQRLRDEGLSSTAEQDASRRAIIDSV